MALGMDSGGIRLGDGDTMAWHLAQWRGAPGFDRREEVLLFITVERPPNRDLRARIQLNPKFSGEASLVVGS